MEGEQMHAQFKDLYDLENMDAEDDALERLNYPDLDCVSNLQRTQRYINVLQKVDNALAKGSEIQISQGIVSEENQFTLECNSLSVDIENETLIVHNFIRDQYRLKFPELESLIHQPVDYARVIKIIGNETDLTIVDLEGLLPSAVRMAVYVTASTTKGKPLSADILQKTMDACDRVLDLDASRKKLLEFVETRMGYIAPNLSAIVGSAVAAKLMGTAGGLSALANMSACDIQVLGKRKNILAGFSTATSQFCVGYLEETELYQRTPPALRKRAGRLLAGKATLAARVDFIRGDSTGGSGQTFRAQVVEKIAKWQEPPPAKRPKPLPVPDLERKKKRGGQRLRKQKDRYATTDMRKLQNRMPFGVQEESTLGDGLGEGYGMLGRAGNGKLRVSAPRSNLAKKLKVKSYGSGAATSGLTLSFAFTPVQGIELSNPQAYANQLGSGTQSTYFGETGTFTRFRTN